jgi:hypothetical protein
MKFKIRKDQLDMLKNVFEKKDVFEIELEAVMETATQAVYEKNIRDTAFHQGYHYGFREGVHASRKPSFCGCGCGGNNCHLRLCDEHCHLYNI